MHDPDHSAAAAPAALAQLEAHWRALRGPRAMPARGELVAARIEAALPVLFIAEPVAPGVLRLRHAGRKLGEMLRIEPRGMPLCAFFTPEGRAALRALLAAAQERPAILGAGLVAGRGIVAPRVSARLLLLPLADRGLRPGMFVGAIAATAPAPGRALRFDLDGSPVRVEALRPEAQVPRLVASGGRRRAGPRPALRLVVAGG